MNGTVNPLARRKATMRAMSQAITLSALMCMIPALPASAQAADHREPVIFRPGNVVVSRTVYDNRAANVKVG